MLEYHLQGIYILIAFSILLLAFVLIRWFYYSKFRKDRIKWRNIAKNLKNSEPNIMSKNTVQLPAKYSPKEMHFINHWYEEEGIKQLKQIDKRKCIIMNQKPPQAGCKYINVDNVTVNFMIRNNRTLDLEAKQEPRAVTLLLLNEWIK